MTREEQLAKQKRDQAAARPSPAFKTTAAPELEPRLPNARERGTQFARERVEFAEGIASVVKKPEPQNQANFGVMRRGGIDPKTGQEFKFVGVGNAGQGNASFDSYEGAREFSQTQRAQGENPASLPYAAPMPGQQRGFSADGSRDTVRPVVPPPTFAPETAVAQGQDGLAQNGAPFVTDPSQLSVAPAPAAVAPQPEVAPAAPAMAGEAEPQKTFSPARGERGYRPKRAAEPEPTPRFGREAGTSRQFQQTASRPAQAPMPASAPAVQSVMAAASAPPVPVATPTNAPTPPRFVPSGTGPQARQAQQSATAARDAKAIRDQMKRRMGTRDFRNTLSPDRDAGSVPMPPRAPLFEDQDPAAFPTLSSSASSSRPRASFV